jgi:hypothetical protein
MQGGSFRAQKKQGSFKVENISPTRSKFGLLNHQDSIPEEKRRSKRFKDSGMSRPSKATKLKIDPTK